MINKTPALKWLSELKRLEEYHNTDEGALSSGAWITENEAIKMLLQAESILKSEIKSQINY